MTSTVTVFDSAEAWSLLAGLGSPAARAILAQAEDVWGGDVEAALLDAAEGECGRAAYALARSLPPTFGRRAETPAETAAREAAEAAVLARISAEKAEKVRVVGNRSAVEATGILLSFRPLLWGGGECVGGSRLRRYSFLGESRAVEWLPEIEAAATPAEAVRIAQRRTRTARQAAVWPAVRAMLRARRVAAARTPTAAEQAAGDEAEAEYLAAAQRLADRAESVARFGLLVAQAVAAKQAEAEAKSARIAARPSARRAREERTDLSAVADRLTSTLRQSPFAGLSLLTE